MANPRRGMIALLLAATCAWAPAAGPALAEADAGAYLAARAAGQTSDFDEAAIRFAAALSGDPLNPFLLENLILAQVGAGSPEAALPHAETLIATGAESEVANMILLGADVIAGDWRRLFERMEAGQSVGQLVDGLTRAWAHVGTGEMARALPAFDEVIAAPVLRGFGLYHKALALAVAGDFEGADAILSLPPEEGMQRTRRATIAHAMVLSQLGRNADARALLTEVFGADLDPAVADLRARLSGDAAVPYDFVPDARAGMAELYFSVAGGVQNDTPPDFVLLHSRIAEWLDPSHVEARLLSAALLDELGQHDLAVAAYAAVPEDHPSAFAAAMGRAEALRNMGETEAAAEVLADLAAAQPDMPLVQAALGDILRLLRRDEEAIAAYSRALELYPADDPRSWFVHYTRAIVLHRVDDWPAAEADFRRALELNPDQPQVLNYLGYSLVERGEKLDEALDMIERAVAAQPQNGAIVDSLGWVLFKLGKHAEAVVHLERAAELEPVDPIVNDHLGDAFWAVGRLREARFQWARALSFGPEEAEAARIRRKIDIGLDAVLIEEGAAPLGTDRDG